MAGDGCTCAKHTPHCFQTFLPVVPEEERWAGPVWHLPRFSTLIAAVKRLRKSCRTDRPFFTPAFRYDRRAVRISVPPLRMSYKNSGSART